VEHEPVETEVDTADLLEQGDALLASSRQLLDDLEDVVPAVETD
jgi:hypothetical protein